jgi:hypothetical protein
MSYMIWSTYFNAFDSEQEAGDFKSANADRVKDLLDSWDFEGKIVRRQDPLYDTYRYTHFGNCHYIYPLVIIRQVSGSIIQFAWKI